MEDLNELVELAKKYHSAQENVKDRFILWDQEVYPVVKSTLEHIKEELYNQVLFIQPQLEVEEHQAVKNLFGSFLHNSNRRSISLNLSTSMVETFKDSEAKQVYEVEEHGFKIFFSPLPNGRIQIYAEGHFTNGEPQIFQIDLKNNPLDLDEKEIIRLVTLAVAAVMPTSYLFEGDELLKA